MIIQAKVSTASSKTSIELIDGIYRVKFKAVREKGEANKKLLEILSGHFNVPKTKIEIIKGGTSSLKTIKIKE